MAQLKTVPDLRARIESHPLWSLLGIQLMVHLAGEVPRARGGNWVDWLSGR